MGFITIQGENQIAAKQGAGETLNITGFVLANIDGLGAEPVNRIASLPAPADIMDELNVTKFGYVNTNQVVYSLVMDSSIGDYDFNWVGLVDDEGVLIAVTHTPLIQKRATSGGVPGNNLTRNFLIAYSGIQATTAIAVPAETWQIDFNARLHGIDERERLSNFDIYGAASFMDEGWQVVRDGATTTYNVLPGIGYVGGIRIASAVSQQVTVASGPNSIWLDVSLQGDISDVSPVVNFVVSNVAQANYTDPNGFKHYMTKLCSIASGGAVTDERQSTPLKNLIYEKDMPLRGRAIYDTPGNYTWAIPEGVTKAYVTVVGGGGGGGKSSSSSKGAGGGGAGSSEELIDLTGETSVSITVGSGGSGATTSGSSGANGGTSSFGAFISATGGGGGTGSSGGEGGHGIGGNVNPRGASGSDAATVGGSGDGGSSIWGGNGRAGNSYTSELIDGGAYGGGGGGVPSGATQSGKGADGIVIVRW